MEGVLKRPIQKWVRTTIVGLVRGCKPLDRPYSIGSQNHFTLVGRSGKGGQAWQGCGRPVKGGQDWQGWVGPARVGMTGKDGAGAASVGRSSKGLATHKWPFNLQPIPSLQWFNFSQYGQLNIHPFSLEGFSKLPLYGYFLGLINKTQIRRLGDKIKILFKDN